MRYNDKIVVAVVLSAILFGLASCESQVEEGNPYLTTGEVALVNGRLMEAEQSLAKAMTEDEKFDPYMQIGFQLYMLRKFKDAKKSFRKAIDLRPDSYYAYVALYQIEVEANNHRSARKSIMKAISLKKDSPDFWRKYIQLEEVHFLAKSDRINSLYIEALEKTNFHIDIITSYAQFFEKHGDFKSALEQWKHVQERFPDNPLYRNEVSRLGILLKR